MHKAKLCAPRTCFSKNFSLFTSSSSLDQALENEHVESGLKEWCNLGSLKEPL